METSRFPCHRSQADLGPRCSRIIFFEVSEKFETLFSKICAHSARYRNLLAGIFEILDFSWKQRVSIFTGLRPILAQDAQELFFSGFLKSLKVFFRRFVLIASGTEIFWRVYLKFKLFFAA